LHDHGQHQQQLHEHEREREHRTMLFMAWSVLADDICWRQDGHVELILA
jgi:hypothetical protein